MLERASWRALGTSVDLLVLDGDLAAARHAVEALLGDVDRTYSRFRPDSELRRFHAEPEHASPVSALLALALETAIEAARWTDGAVDPTVGAAMRVLGYDGDFAGLADGPAPLTVRLAPVPGWRRIRVDRVAGLARIPRGVELDLGSTGKALASDLGVSTALEAGDARGALLSLGGDLATAGHPPEGGWRILLAEDSSMPPDSGGDVATLETRRHGDVQHDRPALAHLRRRTAPSRHRPAHGAAGRRAVAHRDRRRTHVCPRECRSDGCDRAGRERDPLARGDGAPGAPDRDGRAYPRARRLAGRFAGRGLITRQARPRAA